MEEQDNLEAEDLALSGREAAAIHNILLVGGGSGGHITPLLAIAVALKEKDPAVQVGVIGKKDEDLQEIIDHESIDATFEISAGKFRRYHGESFISHMLDFKTIALNIRDIFRFAAGTWQAWKLLGKVAPDAIMLKGGFVCVPVGFAARMRRIPYITHDSDAVPGLANRLTAKHARYNTTAMPAEMYPYDQAKTVQVGIPIRKEFSHVDDDDQKGLKRELKVNPKDRVLFCTGGGLGAQKLNNHLSSMSEQLLTAFPDLEIIHLSGQKLFEETRHQYHKQLSEELFNRVRVIDFYPDLYKLSGAADVIVSRAGATAIAEFAVQSKACVFVPNPILTGGQQTHNAQAISKNDAAIIVDENSQNELEAAIHSLLSSGDQRLTYGSLLHDAMAFEHSAQKIAEILVDIAQGRGN